MYLYYLLCINIPIRKEVAVRHMLPGLGMFHARESLELVPVGGAQFAGHVPLHRLARTPHTLLAAVVKSGQRRRGGLPLFGLELFGLLELYSRSRTPADSQCTVVHVALLLLGRGIGPCWRRLCRVCSRWNFRWSSWSGPDGRKVLFRAVFCFCFVFVLFFVCFS